MTGRRVTFTVRGSAQPKGSTRAVVPKSWAVAAYAAGVAPRAVTRADNARTKPWQALVAYEARIARGDADPFAGAVVLTVTCFLPRPKSLPKKQIYPTRKPDLDKLLRAVLDALTGVLYRDDAQVVDVVARKAYATSPLAPCARIVVEEAAPPMPVPVVADVESFPESTGE